MNNNNFTFETLQLIRDLLRQIRFYTANIPKEILPDDEWDKTRKNFSEIDMAISKAQGKAMNGENE